LLFLKDQGIATKEKLAPHFVHAANPSEVRERAAYLHYRLELLKSTMV